MTTQYVNFVVTFFYPIGYKKVTTSQSFHQSKINGISCTLHLHRWYLAMVKQQHESTELTNRII